MRAKYELPRTGEVVVKERIPNAKGYRYRLSNEVMSNWGYRSNK